MIKNVKHAKELVKRYKKFEGKSWHELQDQTGIGGTATCILCKPLIPTYSHPSPQCKNCIWSIDSDAGSKHCLNENYRDLSWEQDGTEFRRLLAERVVMLEERITTQNTFWKRLLRKIFA